MTHYFDRIRQQMQANWEKPALCDYKGDIFTFCDTAIQIERLHLLFEQMGIQKGDRIALCGKNQARWAVAFLAINTYEAVVVPLLANFHPDNIRNILNISECKMLFTDVEIWQGMGEGNLGGLRQAISLADFEPLWCEETDREKHARINGLFDQKYPHGMTADDVHYPTDNDKELAIINYTSGSTGDPKGVMLRYECFSANVEYGQANMPSSPNDTLLSILPLAHMFGMVFELLYPLCGGTPIYFLGKAPSPSILMKALRDVRPYLITAVPMIFEKIYGKKIKPLLSKPMVRSLMYVPFIQKFIFKKIRREIDATFGGNIRLYIMGGAAVNPEVERFFHKIGLHFTIGYGMTEAAPLLTYERWDKFVLRSCGKAMSFLQLRIDSDNPSRKPGEIQAKGISLFSGYYKNEEATRAAFTDDGWFRTGDTGVIDKAGNVFIRGRLKSMLLSSNGQNIYPEEIESIIINQPFVLEAVVVMRNDKLVALCLLDQDAMRKNGVGQVEVVNEIVRATNEQTDPYSKISAVEVRTEPFEKTAKLSIKRYLYS
ncbi:MAG: AMP-binding protein [Bacteroidales bacterium]|nr:AMP-binding protein [Bacteroidales bacterium]